MQATSPAPVPAGAVVAGEALDADWEGLTLAEADLEGLTLADADGLPPSSPPHAARMRAEQTARKSGRLRAPDVLG